MSKVVNNAARPEGADTFSEPDSTCEQCRGKKRMLGHEGKNYCAVEETEDQNSVSTKKLKKKKYEQ
jgi:hypothetical protein